MEQENKVINKMEEPPHALTDEQRKMLEGDDQIPLSKIFSEILKIFENIDDDYKVRIIKSIIEFFDLKELKNSSSIIEYPNSYNHNSIIPKNEESNNFTKSFFSEKKELSPKEFIVMKEPQSDVEKVACLAYYLTHYKNQPYFKTNDISILNTDAAQRKFSNTPRAVDNAYNYGYLVTATKGNKQLSPEGEMYVQLLPDREAAKEIMKKYRKKTKKSKNIKLNTDVKD